MDRQAAEYKKLRWRTRRGMLELDLLLAPFFDERYLELSEAQQRTFVELLGREDADLFDWFNRIARPQDERLAAMVDMILASVKRPL